MLSILILIVIYSSVESTDWCPLVKPNSAYEGLGLYHRFNNYGSKDYVMFNRKGKQWIVIISKDLSLTPKDNSETSVEDNGVINKFGTFALYEISLNKPGGRPRECSIITQGPRASQIVCRDANNGIGAGLNLTGSSDFVIMKVRAETTPKSDAWTLLFIRSSDKTMYYMFNPFIDVMQIDCTESKEKSCRVPLFVQQMDYLLFTKINGIVDYTFKKGPKGHLILFNIGGKPMYCTTAENQPLSEECKRPENMKTLFKDCFNESESTAVPSDYSDSYDSSDSSHSYDDSQASDPSVGKDSGAGTLLPGESKPDNKGENGKKDESKDEESSGFGLIIVIIVVVVIIIVGIIVFVVIYSRKSKTSAKEDEIETENNSLVKSESIQSSKTKTSMKSKDSSKK